MTTSSTRPHHRRRRPWRTVRFRITAAALVAVLVVLAVAAVALVGAQRSQLIDQVDADLEAQALQLALTMQRDGIPADLPVASDDAIQVVAADGTVLARSGDLDDLDDPDGDDEDERAAPSMVAVDRIDFPDDRAGDDGDDELGELEAELEDVALPDGDPGRAAVVAIATDGGPVALIVARSEVEVDDAVESLAGTLLLTVPIVSILLAATTWFLVGRTLRPVDDIRRRVGEIGADDLAKRVPEPDTDDEVDRLARTMNAMLDRLEGAAGRERQFVSDASHELRSPLTRMRLALEVDRDHPETADRAATNASLLDDVAGMEQLVTDLLQLAAGDATAGERRPVDLDEVVRTEAGATVGPEVRALDLTGVEPVQVVGDVRALGRAVRNLLDNAVRHATTTVSVTLRATPSEATLVVADDGPGISPADRERVFERFVRLDDARTAGTAGTGLGLAIVRAIVERHGGSIAAAERPGGGTAMTVRLPLLA